MYKFLGVCVCVCEGGGGGGGGRVNVEGRVRSFKVCSTKHAHVVTDVHYTRKGGGGGREGWGHLKKVEIK